MKERADGTPVEDAALDSLMVNDQQRQLLRICQRGFDMVPFGRQRESGTIGFTTCASVHGDLWISEHYGTLTFPHQLDDFVKRWLGWVVGGADSPRPEVRRLKQA